MFQFITLNVYIPECRYPTSFTDYSWFYEWGTSTGKTVAATLRYNNTNKVLYDDDVMGDMKCMYACNKLTLVFTIVPPCHRHLHVCTPTLLAYPCMHAASWYIQVYTYIIGIAMYACSLVVYPSVHLYHRHIHVYMQPCGISKCTPLS